MDRSSDSDNDWPVDHLVECSGCVCSLRDDWLRLKKELKVALLERDEARLQRDEARAGVQ